jgi:hypothetical protein
MAASIAVAILTLVAATTLISGVALAARQFLFIAKSYRVLGTVASEQSYRMYGRQMRYYRIDFCLSNGQSIHLRSSATTSSGHPKIGEKVPVLIREGNGKVKARIGTMTELWFVVIVLLFIGCVGSFVMFPIAFADLAALCPLTI